MPQEDPRPERNGPDHPMKIYRPLFEISLAGLIAGTAGVFAGGFIGAATCDWNIREAGCVEQGAYGAIIGESILLSFALPLIILLRHRVSRVLVLLIPTAVGVITASGLAWAIFVDGQEESAPVAIPAAHLIVCIATGWLAARCPYPSSDRPGSGPG